MICAFDILAHPGVDLVVALHPEPGLDFIAPEGCQSILLQDFPGQADRLTPVADVAWIGEVIEQDRGRILRQWRADGDPPPAARLIRADVDLKAVSVKGRAPVIAHGRGQKVVLDVRPLHSLVRADKGAGLEVIGRAEAGLGQHPPRPYPRLAERVQPPVERDRLGAAVLEVYFQMVLQIGAHPGQVHYRHNARFLQQCRRADARALQQRRRADGAGRQNNLTAGHDLRGLAPTGNLHPDRAGAVEQDPLRQHPGDDLQVGPLARWREEGVCRRLAPPTGDVHLHGAKALLLITVIVLGNRVAGLLTGGDKGIIEGVQQPVVTVADTDLPTPAAVAVLAEARAFEPLVVRQQAGVVPALCASLFPLVQIARTAANESHAIDARRTTEHLATRAVHHPASQPRLGVGPIAPVELVLGHGDRQRRGHLHENRPVAAAELQQSDPDIRVLGQPGCNDGAGRAAAHDHVVKFGRCRCWRGVCGGQNGLVNLVWSAVSLRILEQACRPVPPPASFLLAKTPSSA